MLTKVLLSGKKICIPNKRLLHKGILLARRKVPNLRPAAYLVSLGKGPHQGLSIGLCCWLVRHLADDSAYVNASISFIHLNRITCIEPTEQH